MSSIEINGRKIGEGYPVYVVAEMSANHNQDYEQAAEIVRAAKEAGADAIKLQTYTPDTLTIDCDNTHFRIKGTIWEGRNLYQLYTEAYTPWDWQPKLKILADSLGLEFFSTPFDSTAVDFLENTGIPAYKVASFELVDLPLLRRIARCGKPIILSTGMASLAEIDEAVQAIRGAGGRDLVLLKCTSAYPSPPEEMNLRAIPHLRDSFGVPAGLSDHTLGVAVPIAAAALGACLIEKHLTLSRKSGGPDCAFSLEPKEFKEMVKAVRTTEKALGSVQYGSIGKEKEGLNFRRSLFAVKDIKSGDEFSESNIRSIRPASGLHPKYYNDILGKRAKTDIKRGTPLSWDLLL